MSAELCDRIYERTSDEQELDAAFTGTIKKALVDISGEVTEDLEAKVKMYLARQ